MTNFGISTATFFAALLLWCGICYVLAKMEDNRAPAQGAAAISDTSSNRGTAYAAPGTAADTNSNKGFGNSGSSGDGGYLPVAIPSGNTGGNQNRI